MLKEFPKPLAITVGDVVGSYYYSHRRLETMLYEAVRPGTFRKATASIR